MENQLNCIYRVINFVEKHYDQPIAIQELEDISHYSYRNIQRIFKYSCGETIGSFQQRLKIENAYKRILYTSEPLTSIGLEVGFATIASFSKAFKQHFGISPKEARAGKAALLCGSEPIPIVSDSILKPDIVYLAPTQVYYRSILSDYEPQAIEGLWERLLQDNFKSSAISYYGVIADEPLIKTTIRCRYDACTTVDSCTKKLPSKMILGGRYARFKHLGSYETIDETYTKIYAGWIFESGLEFSHGPIIEKYETHADDTVHTEDQLTYILLPLK